MNALIPMQFDGADIRVITDDAGEPWFVGKDVAEALGYTNPNKAMQDHCKGVTKRHPLSTAGGMQEVRVLAEPDVLRLIVKSSLPAAERFERWVFEEVLPAIRKTGGYGKPAIDPASLTRMDLLKLAMEAEEERIALAGQVKVLAHEVEVMQPKAIALDRFASHDGQHNVRNASKLLGVRERLFVTWVITNHWLYRDHSGRLCARADKIAAGLLDTVPVDIQRSDGVQTLPQPVITQKGLAKLAVLLARDGLLPKKEEAA